MRNRLILTVCLFAVAALAVMWLRPDELPTKTAHNIVATPQSTPSATAPIDDSPTVVSDATLPTTHSESITDPTGTFRTDGTGKLVVDEQTRLNMEALLAKTNPADLPQVQEEIVQKLPPTAAAQASALLDHFQNYSKAQRQAYPPGAAPATEEAALAELDGLHALRVAHFGADIAHALYGAEEALTRSLIELMRLEKDQSLTLEEKAAQAQQLYDTLPELSRVQRSD
jgi:lipase chaperone LimK